MIFEELEVLLSARSATEGPRKWSIRSSEEGGRGLFTNCDIASGELIFDDVPAITGPKTTRDFVGCTSCNDHRKPLRSCSGNCRLPFCSEECECDDGHKKECEFLKTLNLSGEEWSPNIYRTLSVLRSLFMSEVDRKVVSRLYASSGKKVEGQVATLINCLQYKFDEEQVAWLKHCCGVLDGTSFEIELPDLISSLKGLYPLSAMMNHNCVPNVRLSYTSRADGYRMLVKATKGIPEGAEIFTNYCPLLWGTNLRRTFLVLTKHFQCNCLRCQDPAEFGTNLQALKCRCGQLLLPHNPLSFTSSWGCSACGTVESSKYCSTAQKNVRNLNDVDCGIPKCNYMQRQAAVEMVFKMTKPDALSGATDQELRDVTMKFKEILHVVDQLQLGNTNLKGKLCIRLGLVSREMEKRNLPLYESEIKIISSCGQFNEREDELDESRFT